VTTTPALPDPITGSEPPRPGRTGDQPVTTLRGAGARVNPQQVARVALGLVLGTLLTLTVVFSLVGAHKNQQIDDLRDHGVPVAYTVSKCVGQLGGSGSNVAGFSCQGTYRIDGRTYAQPLPGTAFYAPGTTVHAIAVPADPTLLSVPSIVRAERASMNVYILPAVFFALFVLVVVAVALQHRRARAKGQAGGV
jgi:hypothetical protein